MHLCLSESTEVVCGLQNQTITDAANNTLDSGNPPHVRNTSVNQPVIDGIA